MVLHRPSRSRFSALFLAPIANADMVPKLQTVLYASHPALPISTPKFHSKASPLPTLILKLSHNAIFHVLALITNRAECSTSFICCVKKSYWFLLSFKHTILPPHPYQKSKRALSENFQSRKFSVTFPVINVAFVKFSPDSFFLLLAHHISNG
jgi:hypothetical protein